MAVSAANMPKANFTADSDTLYTVCEPSAFVSGKTQNSVLINEILKAGADVAQCGNQNIYATPYITINGENYVCSREVRYSLRTVLESVDTRWTWVPKANRESVIEKIYDPYVSQLTEEPWNLPNIKAQKEGILYPKTLKILSIGNSFSQDATYYLKAIAEAEGYADIQVAYLYIGGCTLKTHAQNVRDNAPAYKFYTNYSGTWSNVSDKTMLYGIVAQDWDVITLQQGSSDSGMVGNYEPYLTELINYVNANKTNPDARLLWHTTWAYQHDCTLSAFARYDNDQMTMYNAIMNAVQTNVLPHSEFDVLLPCGTAIQNARSSYLGDTLTRDGYHMSKLGRVITAYLWLSVMLDVEFTEIKYQPTDFEMTQKDRDLVVEVINNAIRNPHSITQSAYTS